MDKLAIINRIKRSYQSIRIAGIRPTGVLATRTLVLVMLVPMVLVVAQYVLSTIKGYVSPEANQLIDKGVFIIDHIFVPPVLMTIVGLCGMFIDKNHNGIPDKLEEQTTLPLNRPSIQQLADEINHDERGK
ncbi:hypothetical protein [Veillonella sp.]|uniref:hypothetical protein n=1 Tax=Veillonella sp. TaxID=1926307 RepID=UPI00257DA873|nr:hypothetical protein [Veillonella sp.]MBS5100227.1 hypothetical protein [Veillonella sp.]